MTAVWRKFRERLRLFFRGAERETRAMVRWKAEHSRTRDAVGRFIGAGLESALLRGVDRQATDRGPVALVGISVAEWMLLIETLYGTDHPKTVLHRRLLAGKEPERENVGQAWPN